MRKLLLLLLLVVTSPAATVAPPMLPLQALIDLASAGTTLRLAPGRYAGPAYIDKPLTIDGEGRAEVVGDGRGSVVAIRGYGVTLRGLLISGSGESHDGIDAGVTIEGDGHRVIDNRMEDVLFGIHLRQVAGTVVAGNEVVGKARDLGLRGDAIRVWNGSGNRIEDNRFRRVRDITFVNSPDNHLSGNHLRDGRYGLQAVFSPRLLVEDNDIADTGTGLVILYSRDVILRGNTVAHALDGGGAGIVFKESDTGVVSGNTIQHCAIGLKVDAPPESADGSGLLDVRDNRFAHNIIGMFFYGEGGGHRFENNRFENNLTTVAISGQGAGAANVWQRNRWDEYEGFDRNHDGIGDTPHVVWLHADRIWMENPMATFFRNSPALELLDFLERLAPFSLPYRILRDDQPRMN